ncbi:response regulator [Paenibacillus fonticola]|uniref:response regulator n=1 Tax=Paenibacillus fonticola TaxID=379896 RepID=UPI00036DDABE|nr:response regulator [Paenibacillus fonticola]
MYTLLLVDDERYVLDTLEQCVAWEEMGFEVVGTAKNGRDAINKTKELRPDIVITDVKMPIMNGIDYARAARAMFPHLKMIFLSGYDEFNYVKSALQLEASGYLLKPLNLDELRSLMGIVKEKCSQEERNRQSSIALAVQYMKELLFTDNDEERARKAEEIHKLGVAYLGYPFQERASFVTLLTLDEYRFLSEFDPQGKELAADMRNRIREVTAKIKALVIEVDERQFLIVSPSPLAEPILDWYRDLAAASAWMSVCAETQPIELEELPSIRKRLLEQRNEHVFLYGPGHYIAADHQDTAVFNTPDEVKAFPSIEEGMGLILQGLREEAGMWVGGYLRTLDNMDSKADRLHEIRKKAVRLLDRIYETIVIPHKGIGERVEDKTIVYNKLAVMESLPLLERTLRSLIGSLIDAIQEMHTDKHMNTVNRVKELIAEEYDRPLTIEHLAEQVYISPNYLRTIFKERTGSTILEFITQVRMDRALDLLRSSPLKIHEIAARIGYENTSHFCAIFLKFIGMTPNQYRQQLPRL